MSDRTLYRYEPANHGDPDIGLHEAIEWGMVPVEPDAVIEVNGSILAEILGVSGSGTYAILIRQEADDE